jgi:outer membrane protein assembly factor BamE (lipoprotein component of BamABCDE complex)
MLHAVAAIATGGPNPQSGATAGRVSQSQQVRNYTDQTLAKIVPGHTTKPEVEALLGRPWRDTQLDEEDVMPGDPAVEVWEYRGRASQGTYRVHIQFDKSDVTTLVARIPDKTARAIARVAKPVVDSRKP